MVEKVELEASSYCKFHIKFRDNYNSEFFYSQFTLTNLFSGAYTVLVIAVLFLVLQSSSYFLYKLSLKIILGKTHIL